jgi:hypothetical protein
MLFYRHSNNYISMERITSLRTIHGRMSFEDARKAAMSVGARLISNRLAGKSLSESISCGSDGVYTGTIVAFPNSGRPFGPIIEFICHPVTYLLDTSGFCGDRGKALVFEDFDIVEEERTRRFVIRTPPGLVNFPQYSGWYGADATYGVPDTHAHADPKTSVYLHRPQEARVVPIVRKYGPNGKLAKDIILTSRPTQPREVLVEASLQAEELGRVLPFRK